MIKVEFYIHMCDYLINAYMPIVSYKLYRNKDSFLFLFFF